MYLDNFDVYERFTRVTSNFIKIFEQNPNVVLVDSHPTYQSTIYGNELAREMSIDLHKIQHHKAHFTSVLGEHDLFDSDEKVLGVVWDGTGYGDDKQIWGGEFFEYQNSKINRITHFNYFNWIASDKMSKEPRLSLLSLANNEMQSILKEKFSDEELSIYQSLKKNNKLKTSSVGRLFDAVASLLNICDINTYEGEAAILLENAILDYDLKSCKSYCSVSEDNSIHTEEMLSNLFSDYKSGTPKEKVIANFLYSLTSIIFNIAKNQNIKKIAFSGGVFQNTTLVDMIKEIGETKYNLYFNRNLAPNDENIAFGQIMHYLNIK